MGGNTVKVTAGGPDIDAGAYPAKFTGAEIFDPVDAKGVSTSQFGPSRRWKFEALDDGELVDVDCLTSLAVSPGSRGGKILAAIMGRQPEMDEEIDLDDLKAKPVQVVIAPNKKNWMVVETVLPAKKAK